VKTEFWGKFKQQNHKNNSS